MLFRSAALSPAASPPPTLCALSARGAAAPLSRLLVLPPDAPPLSSLPDGSELTSATNTTAVAAKPSAGASQPCHFGRH